MKKLLVTTTALMSITAGASFAAGDDVKIGVLLGFTGPLESLIANMAPGAELAIKEASESGKLLGGRSVVAVRGDSTCVDAAAATAAAERLITSDKVNGIVGAACSGCHDRGSDQRGHAERDGDDLALRDIPRPVLDRG